MNGAITAVENQYRKREYHSSFLMFTHVDGTHLEECTHVCFLYVTLLKKRRKMMPSRLFVASPHQVCVSWGETGLTNLHKKSKKGLKVI